MEFKPYVGTQETEEVLRRVGRNLVNFQYVEYLLKRLTVHFAPVGPASKMEAQFEKHAVAVNSSTMGALAGKLMETVLKSPTEKPVPQDIDEIWMGFRFSLGVDAQFVDNHEKEMQALVDARNELIHHFLPRWHSSVAGDTTSVCEYLDSQLAEIKRMMARLQDWVRRIDNGRAMLAGVLNSPEFEQHSELMHLRSSGLVAMLGEVATRAARSDGWTLFTTAANLIRREAPDELIDIEGRFGLPSLMAVLLATEFFEVADEQLPNGFTRKIYRISDRWEFELRSNSSAESGDWGM